MDLKLFAIVFGTIFLAELGDKTQLATLLFASGEETSRLVVFAAASLALVATSAIGVFAGGLLAQHVSARVLHVVAGVGFLVIGAWMLLRA